MLESVFLIKVYPLTTLLTSIWYLDLSSHICNAKSPLAVFA